MKVDDLLSDLLPDVPGCPRVTARERLIKAAQQFARDSHAWNQEVERRRIREGVIRIDLPVPRNTRLVAITSVVIDGTPVNYEWSDGAIVLTDTFEGMLVVRAVLEPADDAVELVDDLARYRDAILDYARMRLMMMPRQEWTNPELGFAFGQQYQVRVTDARVEIARGRTTQPLRVKPQPWI